MVKANSLHPNQLEKLTSDWNQGETSKTKETEEADKLIPMYAI